MELYKSETEYCNDVKKRSALPEGFRAASIPLSFFPEERKIDEPLPMNLSAIVADEPTVTFEGMFTRSAFPGAPVVIGRKRLENSLMRGVLINNKIANVCVKPGIDDAEALAAAFGSLLGCSGDELFLASTGIIGWRLPVKTMEQSLPNLHRALQDTPAARSIFSTARGIMTTDRYPKVRCESVGEGRIIGVAKGAGMIEPNMATMLVFILTDVALSRQELKPLFSRVVHKTFNRISIDSDQSTSDMAIVLSSNKKQLPSLEAFEESLFSVCKSLAHDIVRNGEGTTHVIRATVSGARSDEEAVGIGKAIVNSPLVKTAVFGNDPNVGRIISSLGDYMGNSGIDIDADMLTLSLGGQMIFSRGCFTLDQKKEVRLTEYLKQCSMGSGTLTYPPHQKVVDIHIDLGIGSCREEVLGSDLTYDYIRENADYRS